MRIVMTILGLEQTSGVSVFCVETANTLAAAGHEVSILCKSHFAYLPDSRVRLVRDSSLAALKARPDVVHVHAIWSIFCIRAMAWSLLHHVPFVFSPHGGLMPRVFQKGRVKKWLFWHLVAKHFVKRAAAIHCTSEAEREACEKLGLKGPFVIAPLGVHLPALVDANFCSRPQQDQPTNVDLLSRPTFSPLRVLFLGRLGEEKGLLNLLEAWRQILEEVQSSKLKVESSEFRVQSSEFKVQSSKVDGGGNTELSTLNFKLILAGPDWLGYKKVLDAKIAAEHIENVEFTGPVQGAEKDRLYREADIFVLPSPMENFSMVVLEALAYGLPVIATKGTPWSEIEGNPDLPSTVDLLSRPTFSSAVAAGKCGCWIDQGVEPLKQALSRLLNAQPSTLNLLGANGRALAARRYQWPAISDKLLGAYEKIVK